MSLADRIEIGLEAEEANGWSYRVARLDAHDCVVSTHTVLLSWVDHDALSGGTSAPSCVMLAILQALLDAGVSDWPERFDASTARRWIPSLPEVIAQRL